MSWEWKLSAQLWQLMVRMTFLSNSSLLTWRTAWMKCTVKLLCFWKRALSAPRANLQPYKWCHCLCLNFNWFTLTGFKIYLSICCIYTHIYKYIFAYICFKSSQCAQQLTPVNQQHFHLKRLKKSNAYELLRPKAEEVQYIYCLSW